MKDRQEHKETVEIPKGTGRQGFLLAIDTILKMPRVQGVQIDARGKVTYTRFVEEGEPIVPTTIDFESLLPHSVIRNAEVIELSYPADMSAAVVAGLLFAEVTKDRLFPIAFVGGPASVLWDWHAKTTGLTKTSVRDEFYGLPFYPDRMMEDYMLFLCAGYSRGAALADTQKSYKILMPEKVQ